MLIDGPWFDFLNCIGSVVVEMPVVHLMEDFVDAQSVKSAPAISQLEVVRWGMVRWSPECALYKSDARRSHSFTSNYSFEKWRAMLNNRTKTGWYVMPDGRLPLSLNLVDGRGLDDVDWWHLCDLMEVWRHR